MVTKKKVGDSGKRRRKVLENFFQNSVIFIYIATITTCNLRAQSAIWIVYCIRRRLKKTWFLVVVSFEMKEL